jgi:cytochrome c-type biogenesis protein CcsB
MSVSILLFKFSLLTYFAATVFFLVDIIAKREKAGRIGRWVLVGGFALHCVTLVARYLEAGYTPVSNLHESLSFSAWSLVGIYLLFDLRYRLTIVGAFIAPLALVTMIFGGATVTRATQLNPVLESWWFPIHVALAFLGNAVFTLAAVVGVMYLIQERLLKSKKFSTLFYRLPSLSTLDQINYKCLSFGFPLMTMGIISGAVWANSAWGGYWRWDPKETWALIVWLNYAAWLHLRFTKGLRGTPMAWWSIAGLLITTFAFLGVNMFLSGLHSYGEL